MVAFLKSPRLWLALGCFFALLIATVAYFGRGEDFPIEWTREVPSRLSLQELEPALRDMRAWPVYMRELKEAYLVKGASTEQYQRFMKERFEVPGVGSEVILQVEPKGKEWKRYQVRAEVIALEPGKRIRFRLIEESTGKTARLLDGLEWEVSIHPSEGRWKERGYPSYVRGQAVARTRSRRSRFLGRVFKRSMMNQIYWIDLVRLASFVENQAAWAGNHAPVYR
jgi:hypothetical protein